LLTVGAPRNVGRREWIGLWIRFLNLADGRSVDERIALFATVDTPICNGVLQTGRLQGGTSVSPSVNASLAKATLVKVINSIRSIAVLSSRERLRGV
jgi:hypothetical protein